MRKTLVGFLVGIILIPGSVSAQSLTPEQTLFILNQIQELLEMVRELKIQLAEVQANQEEEEEDDSECEDARDELRETTNALDNFDRETEEMEQEIREQPGLLSEQKSIRINAYQSSRYPLRQPLEDAQNSAGASVNTECS